MLEKYFSPCTITEVFVEKTSDNRYYYTLNSRFITLFFNVLTFDNHPYNFLRIIG